MSGRAHPKTRQICIDFAETASDDQLKFLRKKLLELPYLEAYAPQPGRLLIYNFDIRVVLYDGIILRILRFLKDSGIKIKNIAHIGEDIVRLAWNYVFYPDYAVYLGDGDKPQKTRYKGKIKHMQG